MKNLYLYQLPFQYLTTRLIFLNKASWILYHSFQQGNYIKDVSELRKDQTLNFAVNGRHIFIKKSYNPPGQGGVAALQQWYQARVVRYHQRVLDQCTWVLLCHKYCSVLFFITSCCFIFTSSIWRPHVIFLDFQSNCTLTNLQLNSRCKHFSLKCVCHAWLLSLNVVLYLSTVTEGEHLIVVHCACV